MGMPDEDCFEVSVMSADQSSVGLKWLHADCVAISSFV